MKTVLIVLGLIVGLVVVYFLIVGLWPGFAVPAQALKRPADWPSRSGSENRLSSRDVTFEVGGDRISAWLYLPESISGKVPCIVLGQGLGGTKECGLDYYAARFQQAGFAALAFDYRYFGQSGGEPRQLIRISDQLDDWAAAIKYARGLDEVDPAKVALWGTSLGGGHVIIMAARDQALACVAAQCPGLDGKASAHLLSDRLGLGLGLRLLVHAQRDLVRSWLGLSPHRIPLVGKPGTMALMTTPDAYEKFGRIAPQEFTNEACARIAIRGDKYRPVEYAAKVRCPVLLQICDQDSITPLSAAQETEAKLGRFAEVIHYPWGHFDIYLGENLDRSLADQVAFFKKHL